MRAGLLAIMVLRHLRLWLRLLWLLWLLRLLRLLCLRTGATTHPLGATTRAIEPIGATGSTLRAAAIRAT